MSKNKETKKDPLLGMDMEKLGEEIISKSQSLAKKLPVLGHVAWLYSQIETHRYFSFSDIQSRIMPPLLNEQCKLYLETKIGGLPMAFISWAKFNEEAEKKYLSTMKLSPGDWASGDQIWLIDFLMPFGSQEKVIQEVRYKLFPDKKVHIMMPNQGGGFKKISIDELAQTKNSTKTKDNKTH